MCVSVGRAWTHIILKFYGMFFAHSIHFSRLDILNFCKGPYRITGVLYAKLWQDLIIVQQVKGKRDLTSLEFKRSFGGVAYCNRPPTTTSPQTFRGAIFRRALLCRNRTTIHLDWHWLCQIDSALLATIGPNDALHSPPNAPNIISW